MILGQIVGRAWSDRQLPALAGRRFLLVRDVTDGRTTVAVDLLDVGIGATVLVTTDDAAAAACGVSSVDAAVVALVSNYDGAPEPGAVR
ncbi:EutN/CcmL family microcompartment protein [Pseudonocardia acaciae]|uniref:EutN/CcmL family microcompartment protein n=1 Tax=Pseudonocardia acaciae TaxID=551276 RepID=UPI0006889D33|nr:EutN/CcmL family microcompartment protein [Pseudonocardia acaciae]